MLGEDITVRVLEEITVNLEVYLLQEQEGLYLEIQQLSVDLGGLVEVGVTAVVGDMLVVVSAVLSTCKVLQILLEIMFSLIPRKNNFIQQNRTNNDTQISVVIALSDNRFCHKQVRTKAVFDCLKLNFFLLH